MKKNNLFLCILCFCLLSWSNLYSQIILSTSDMSANPGTTVSVDIQVANFADVASIQFAFLWDETVLEYQDVTNFGLEGMTIDMNFNPGFTDNGILRFSWTDPNVVGASLVDGSVIFSIMFNVIGELQESTLLEIGNDTTPPALFVELGDSNQNVYDVTIQNGTFTVGPPNSINEEFVSNATLFQNTPNPITDHTVIRYTLKEKSITCLSIYSSTGKVLFNNKSELAPGEHSQYISRAVFPNKGIYFYQLSTDKAILSKKLVVQ